MPDTTASPWTPAVLATLIARAEGDDDTADELLDLHHDPEHLRVMVEQAERGESGGEEETPPPNTTPHLSPGPPGLVAFVGGVESDVAPRLSFHHQIDLVLTHAILARQFLVANPKFGSLLTDRKH